MHPKLRLLVLGALCFATLLTAKQISAEWLARDDSWHASPDPSFAEQSQREMNLQNLRQVEGLRRAIELERIGWPWAAGPSDHLAKLAEAERFRSFIDAGHDSDVPTLAALPSDSYLSSLADALRASPRSTDLRIRLGLAAEQRGDLALAESALLEAARLDRQYLPAWTLANYYFRSEDPGSEERFWHWAKQAALRTYDDDRPLLRLADAMEPNPQVLLRRLGAGPQLEHAYLDYLIGKGHLIEADEVAKVLTNDRKANEIQADDRARIMDLIERHLDAQQVPAALNLRRLLESNLIPRQ